MADVELLPLPEGEAIGWTQAWSYDQMRSYARANVSRATARLQAENERLRAEVEDYRTNGAAAVRFAPNSAHWSNELRRLFGDDARAGIEVLENWHLQELARAERLAEALRLIVEEVDDLLASHPKATTYPDGPCIEKESRATLADARDKALAALAQEDHNG